MDLIQEIRKLLFLGDLCLLAGAERRNRRDIGQHFMRPGPG